MPSPSGEPFGPVDPPPSAAPTLRPAPGRRETVLVLGLAFVLNATLGTALFLAALRTGLLASQVLSLALPPLLAIRLFYLDRRAVLPFGTPAPRFFLAAIAGSAGLNHLLLLYGAWQERVWPMPEPWRAAFESMLRSEGALDFVGLVAAFALAPAVCEEILFRGYVQAGLVRQADRPWRGLVATAVIFGLFHLDPWRFPALVVLGLFLGWLRRESGSLWPAMTAHAVFNLITLALTAAGRLRFDHAPGSALTAISAAGLLTLGLFLGRRPSERAAERML